MALNSVGSQVGDPIGTALVRIPIVINFALLLLLISPVGQNRQLYMAMRNAGFGEFFIIALQLWFTCSTIFVTGFYFWRRLDKSDEIAEQLARKRTLDGGLLLAWWIVLIGVILYAFNMGMGG